MIHTCLNHLVIVHSEGSDARHKLEGVQCPCLPRVFCAVCERVLAKLGEVREIFLTRDNTTHVYPAYENDE